MVQGFKSSYYTDRFEFIGGWLCLDFANTINYAGTPGIGAGLNERLKGFSELAAWGCLSGLINDARAKDLLDAAQHQPLQAHAKLEEARALRLAIHHVFSAAVNGQAPDPADMATLNTAMRQATPFLQIKHTPRRFDFDWTADSTDLDQIVRPVVWSTVALLTSEHIRMVKRCQGTGCAWLFLDETKNHSRRWCDMAHCGNRAKASRHYARHR